jgi:hypothetical protein
MVVRIAAVFITFLLILVFVRSALPKLTRDATVTGTAAHLKVPVRLMYTVGYVEILGVAGIATGLAYPVVGVAAAAGLTLLMLGATTSHIRVCESWKITLAPLTVAALAGALTVLQARLR